MLSGEAELAVGIGIWDLGFGGAKSQIPNHIFKLIVLHEANIKTADVAVGVYLELREVQRDALHRSAAFRSARLRAADEDVFQLDLEILERFVSGLPDGDQPFPDVFSGGAGEHQLCRRGIGSLHERKVLKVGLAGSTAAACSAGHRGVADAPRKAEELNLARVLVVRRFPFDSVELQKHVDCHWSSST